MTPEQRELVDAYIAQGDQAWCSCCPIFRARRAQAQRLIQGLPRRRRRSISDSVPIRTS